MTINITVLASGRGSNLQAILDAIDCGKIDGRVVLVLSDKAEAKALEIAHTRGIMAAHIDPKAFAVKAEYEEAMLSRIAAAESDLICLAGYMRILSPYFVQHAPCPVMNIHPALLPAFPGLHAQRQALEYGAKVTGCTVHFVDEGMDTGSIILQRTVPVLEEDTEDSLSARILKEEHQAYAQAIALFAQGKLEFVGRVVKVKGE